MDLLADLNEAQRRAVTHTDGPLLVLAAAGSGKTRVITRRIAYLVDQGARPGSVLAITFTNKAAGEMKQRVAELGAAGGAVVGTFHWLCARLLREFSDRAGLPRNFVIYDADDQLRCLKEALKRAELPAGNFQPASLLSAISRAKARLLEPAEYAEKHGRDFFGKAVARAYRQYQRLLAANGAVDFDDLLLRTALLMRSRPEVREALGRRFRYVLIDEYQDTNHAQYVIAHGIALDHENLCVTGDPDQSIYGWRGADIKNILDFEADYPNAVVVRLERNYRSVQPILSAAGRLIARNRRRRQKELLAVRPGGVEVEVIRLEDEHAEAREAARIVAELAAGGLPRREMAVFYRVNALSRVLEEAFRNAGIAYQVARGVAFYGRKEIKDALAYLRLIVNADDDLSCRRIINVPARGIGAVTVNRLSAWGEAQGASLLEACRHAEAAGLGRAAAAKAAAFAEMIDRLAEATAGGARQAIEAVLARTGMEAALHDDEAHEQARRNLQELVSAGAEFDRQNPGATLPDFLHQVSLVSDIDAIDPASGAVTFMTLHAAKGLEFGAVIVIGCETGLLPFERAGRSGPDDAEEERRLAFVGMTRAKDRLFLTSAKYRVLRGQAVRQAPSPFLLEIGEAGVRRLDKTDFEPRPRRAAVRVEDFYEDADVRSRIEALAAEGIPDEFAGIRVGQRVGHRRFGAGTILSVSYDGTRTRAAIRFDRAGQKTLILEHAHLEPL